MDKKYLQAFLEKHAAATFDNKRIGANFDSPVKGARFDSPVKGARFDSPVKGARFDSPVKGANFDWRGSKARFNPLLKNPLNSLRVNRLRGQLQNTTQPQTTQTRAEHSSVDPAYPQYAPSSQQNIQYDGDGEFDKIPVDFWGNEDEE